VFQANGMVSKDGEEVKFPAPFLFNASTRGVERWLAGLLGATKDAVRTNTRVQGLASRGKLMMRT